nr:MAG: hypothetical protein [Bacteriophage sp.]
MEKFIEKYKSYSSKVLQKLAKVKTGDELDAIESILASRGASQEHPAEEGAVYNATETEEYKAENGIKENDEVAEEKPEKARKTKTPKEPKDPRPLKKEVSAEEAQANLEKAKANIGRFCKFICTKTKEQTDGIIIGVRLDPRNNFIQYRIKTNDGHVWGKGIVSKDLELGEMAPVSEETEKPKRGRKRADEAAPEAEQNEAAPEAEQNEPENAPAEE